MTAEARYRVDVALDYVIADACAILLAIEVAGDEDQRVISEAISIAGVAFAPAKSVANAPARYRWINAVAGPLAIRYQAEVAVARTVLPLALQPATPLSQLPPDIAPYLFASRYCDPVQFQPLLAAEFGHPISAPGDGALIERIRQWVAETIRYDCVSTASTTAADSILARAGICRDFAHLVIAFARAANVPARFVSNYAHRLDPPDFHAVAEVWLGGQWHLVDATGLARSDGMIRIARTEDAGAASFMTIFGSGAMRDQRVDVGLLDQVAAKSGS